MNIRWPSRQAAQAPLRREGVIFIFFPEANFSSPPSLRFGEALSRSGRAGAGGDGLAKGSFITALNSKADGLLPR